MKLLRLAFADSPQRIALSALLLTIGLLPAAAAQEQSQPSSKAEQSDPLTGVPSVPFRWLPIKNGPERGALLVPIELDGRHYSFQLDTGADGTILYGAEAARWGWKKGDRDVRVPNVRLGALQIPAAKLAVLLDMPTPLGDAAGTVGLDLLLGATVVIDYPRQRFAVLPRADAPSSLLRPAARAPGVIRNGKFFIAVKLNGTEVDDLFFDSGSSAFPLMVDFERWKALTGLPDERAATSQFRGTSWGKAITFPGAPALGALEIGGVKIDHPLVYFRASEPSHFKEFPFKAGGAIGNAPFWNRIVVLNLGVHPSLGLLEPPRL